MTIYLFLIDRFIQCWHSVDGPDESVVAVAVMDINCTVQYNTYVTVRNGMSVGLQTIPNAGDQFIVTENVDVDTPTGRADLPDGEDELASYLIGIGLMPPMFK